MYRWIALLLLMGCGGPAGTGGVGGGSAGAGGGGGSAYRGTCCINGSFHDCQTREAFDKCAGFDVFACHSACNQGDFNCLMACDMKAQNATHDPSACSRVASRDSECNSGAGGGGGGSSSGSCVGSRGVACTYSTQCASGNCTNGYCYPTTNGNPCTYSTQCGSGNCTNSCCRGNSAGSSCTYSTQCTSGNCTNGKCQ